MPLSARQQPHDEFRFARQHPWQGHRSAACSHPLSGSFRPAPHPFHITGKLEGLRSNLKAGAAASGEDKAIFYMLHIAGLLCQHNDFDFIRDRFPGGYPFSSFPLTGRLLSPHPIVSAMRANLDRICPVC